MARARAFEPVLYGLVAGAVTLYVATRFYASLKLQVGYAHDWAGPGRFARFIELSEYWSAPLDDVFIHFDFARSIVRGHPFEWSQGAGYSSGGTSLLYPFMLALGLPLGFVGMRLMEWAAILACVSVFCTLCLCRRMFAGLPRVASYVAPFALLSVGALDWSLFSGMEVALFLAVWTGAYCAWDDLFTSTASPAPGAPSRGSWALGVWGGVLVMTRPEAAALVALFAASAALKHWSHGRRSALEILARGALPAALVLGLHAVANRILTGDSTAAGALVKLELYHPYFAVPQVLDAWWFHLKYQVLRVTQYHFADPGIFGWLLWLLAAAALLPRATRRHAAMLWASAALWLMVVALNGQVRWQNERYSMPAVAWLLLAGALGLAGLLSGVRERNRRVLRVSAALTGVTAAALFVFYQAPRFREQVWFFGRASRNILEQHVRAALFIREELEPEPNRVMVGDAGAIPYVSDLPALDIIGLGGFRGLPFARATRAQVGAGLELIERLPAEDRPELLALYPSWWGDLPLFFGTPIEQMAVRGNVICGGLSKVLYRSDYSVMEGSAWPALLENGETVADEIDIADLVSEKEHNYRLSPGVIGYVTMKILLNPKAPDRGLWDAGRVIAPGAREMFRLHGVDGRRAFRLILRAAPTETLNVALTIAGRGLGAFHGEPSDSWQELSLSVPALGADALDVVLEPSANERTLYHVWAVQTP